GQPGLPRRRIAGKVVHAGAPIAGAAVRLTTATLHVGAWSLAEIQTDESGRSDLGEWPATEYRVVAQAHGLRAAGATAALRAAPSRPPPDELVIELGECEQVVSGTVRDSAGGVIMAAKVRGAPDGRTFAVVAADEQGRYELCAPAGDLQL